MWKTESAPSIQSVLNSILYAGKTTLVVPDDAAHISKCTLEMYVWVYISLRVPTVFTFYHLLSFAGGCWSADTDCGLSHALHPKTTSCCCYCRNCKQPIGWPCVEGGDWWIWVTDVRALLISVTMMSASLSQTVGKVLAGIRTHRVLSLIMLLAFTTKRMARWAHLALAPAYFTATELFSLLSVYVIGG